MSQQRQFKGLPTFTPIQSPSEPSPLWSPPYQGFPTYQPSYTPPPPVQQPQWPVQPGQTSHCSHCGKELGFIDRFGLNKQMPRCRSCTNQIQQSLQRFRQVFLDVTHSGAFSTNEWAALQHVGAQERLDISEAFAFILKDSVALVERVITQAEANGNITDEVDRYVSQLIHTLRISPDFSQQLLSHLATAKLRANIQRLEHALAQAEAQGELTDEAERHISQLHETLALPPNYAQPLLQRPTTCATRCDR